MEGKASQTRMTTSLKAWLQIKEFGEKIDLEWKDLNIEETNYIYKFYKNVYYQIIIIK